MHAVTNIHENLIDETPSLNQFYRLTTFLSKTRHVIFIQKRDEADNISWRFKFRGHPLILEFDIYSGIRLFSENQKDLKALNEISSKLKSIKL